MVDDVKRRYDNSRRRAQMGMTRQRVIDAAKALFIERGYPATTIESIAEAADTPLPTLYRLFRSKRAILSAVLDVSFGGDDEPIAFADRPAVRAALAEPDPDSLIDAFARIVTDVAERASAIQHVLATAATVDREAAELLVDIRRQRLTGQSRIAKALADRGALASDVSPSEARDIIYALLSPDVHRILTVERKWTNAQYERWVARSLRSLTATARETNHDKDVATRAVFDGNRTTTR